LYMLFLHKLQVLNALEGAEGLDPASSNVGP